MCVVDTGYRRADVVGLREGSDASRQGVIGAPLMPMAITMWNSRRQVRASGIDGLVEDDEVDLLGGDLRRDLREIEHVTGLRQEPRDDELVAFCGPALHRAGSCFFA